MFDPTASATEPTDIASSDGMDTEAVDTGAAGTDPPPTDSPTAAPPPANSATRLPAAQDVPSSPSAGCATAGSMPGESTATFTGADMVGTFILHLPPDVTDPEPLPLVVDLHGYSEPAAIHAVQSGLPAFGDTAGFVTIVPDIDRPVPRWDSTVGSPDVQFLEELLDHIEATVCIDTNRVFVAGLSNGAFMASIVACDLSDRFAAAAPVAGIQAPPDCDPARPVPVIAFHGTADTFVPYTGGLGASVASLPSADGDGTLGTSAPTDDPAPAGPTVAERASTWAVRNGCAAVADETAIAPDVTLLEFGCPAGVEVELYRIEGGGHSWPGSAFSQQIVGIIGATTMSIDATQLMWDFFKAHPLRS